MDRADRSGISREFCEENGLDYEEAKRETDAIAERVEKECEGKPRKEFEKALTEAVGAYLREKLGDKAPEVVAIDLSEGPEAAMKALVEKMKEEGIDISGLVGDTSNRCMKVFGDVVRALMRIDEVGMGDIVNGLVQTLVNSVASGSGLRLRDEYKDPEHAVSKILRQLDGDMKMMCVDAAKKLKEFVRDDELRRN